MGRVVGRDVSGKFDVKIAGLYEIRKISENDLMEPGTPFTTIFERPTELWCSGPHLRVEEAQVRPADANQDKYVRLILISRHR